MALVLNSEDLREPLMSHGVSEVCFLCTSVSRVIALLQKILLNGELKPGLYHHYHHYDFLRVQKQVGK